MEEQFKETDGGPQKKIVMLIIIIFSLVLVTVLGIGVFLIMDKKDGTGVDSFDGSFEKAADAALRGSPEQIEFFQDAFRSAESIEQEALAKLNIGTSRLLANKVGGVDILKEVAAEESYPNNYRASAINYILGIWASNPDSKFAQEVIFDGPVWKDFLTGDSREDINTAVRKAFEWSTSLHSLYGAEYRIAFSYASKTRGETDQVKVSEYTEEALKRIELGDISVNKALNGGIKFGETSRSDLGTGLNRKGLALAELYFAGGVSDRQTVEDAYLDAIVLLEDDPLDSYAKGSSLFARYNYAGFLVRLNDPSRNAGIIKILGPLKTIGGGSVFAFLRGRANEPEGVTVSQKNIIIKLAEVDEDFKKMLLKIGWEDSDFIL